MNKPEIVEDSVVCGTEWIDVRKITVDYLGERSDWYSAERSSYQQVALVVPIAREDEVILVEQFRPSLNDRVLELPGGLVENNPPIEEAKRELLEETGFEAGSVIKINEGPSSAGLTNEYIHVFLAVGCKPADRSPLGDEKFPVQNKIFPLSDNSLGEYEGIVDLKVKTHLSLVREKIDNGLLAQL